MGEVSFFSILKTPQSFPRNRVSWKMEEARTEDDKKAEIKETIEDDKPKSVQEWLEKNERRNSARRKIAKIDANMDPDCQDSYDSFLRTQVFNNNDSNLIKNLSSEKRDEIESFKCLDKFHQIERKIHQQRTAFTDALRQEQAMKMVLAEYDDYGMWHQDQNEDFELQTRSREESRLPDISETNSILPRKSTLPEEYDGQKLKGIEDSPLKIKKSKRVFAKGPSLVTDYAGSKGPKWVAMYQPPYKTVYRAELKKPSLLRQQPAHRIKGYVRAVDLVENEIEKQHLPTRFHFEARKGTFIKT